MAPSNPSNRLRVGIAALRETCKPAHVQSLTDNTDIICKSVISFTVSLTKKYEIRVWFNERSMQYENLSIPIIPLSI